MEPTPFMDSPELAIPEGAPSSCRATKRTLCYAPLPSPESAYNLRPNVKLRGTPMMKPEQRPNADETRESKNASPRRVPLECNVRPGKTLHKTYPPTKTLNNINRLMLLAPVRTLCARPRLASRSGDDDNRGATPQVGEPPSLLATLACRKRIKGWEEPCTRSDPRTDNAGQDDAAGISPTHLTEPKPDDCLTCELRGTPTMRPEQHPCADETHA